jgi:fructose-1,6-bisphosphatase/inositol monophosphatase family enzyme
LNELEEIHLSKTNEAAWNYFDFPDEFYEEDMVIWIDPLDGTQGFIDGYLSHITSMIGMEIDKRPRVGIIHKPFYNQKFN